MVNRNNKESKMASMEKAAHLFELGADLIIYPEGVWNKTCNEFILNLWPGIYRIAKENDKKVIPIVHYIDKPHLKTKENTIHTVVDEPVSFSGMSEKAALNYLRDIMSYWYYLLLENYGKSTRDELINGHDTSDSAWKDMLKQRRQTAERYDFFIETHADYRPKDIVRPEDAFRAISNVKNINAENIRMILDAEKMVREREMADFQRLF